jgi:anhydro-N-acetylmuramic acid kinase
MTALAEALPGRTLTTTAHYGIDPDFVEATAFAWLAMRRLEGLAGNLPGVTGARGPRVLGAVYFGLST